MEAFVFAILGALAGYMTGNFHSKCAKSECCWGCCEVDGAENDVNFTREKTEPILNETDERVKEFKKWNKDHKGKVDK